MLLDVSDRQMNLTAQLDTITVPAGLGKVVANLEELKVKVYPNLVANGSRFECLAERVMLSPMNATDS